MLCLKALRLAVISAVALVLVAPAIGLVPVPVSPPRLLWLLASTMGEPQLQRRTIRHCNVACLTTATPRPMTIGAGMTTQLGGITEHGRRRQQGSGSGVTGSYELPFSLLSKSSGRKVGSLRAVGGVGGDSERSSDAEENGGDTDGDTPTNKSDEEGESQAEKRRASNNKADNARINNLGASGADISALPPAFSFASPPEDEKIRVRSGEEGIPTATTSTSTTNDDDAWLPRFFPPPSEQEIDGERKTIQPLIELPLDGILLQLFPALLIGVLGLVLTVAVQVEASKFDGMVTGEDGGAVVVTDLRETKAAQLPP